MQCSHCAPSGILSKVLSLLCVMFTLTIHGAPKSKHMAVCSAAQAPVKWAVRGNSTRGSGLYVRSVGGFVKIPIDSMDLHISDWRDIPSMTSLK